MANIKIELGHPIIDGMPISFRAPCNCNEVTGIKVEWQDDDGAKFIVFSFADAHSNNLKGLGNLFAAGAMVRVVLDTSSAKAFIQNADTNKYLEGKFSAAMDAAANAKTAADNAQATANGANTAAATAQATAKEAKTNASTAQSTADAAKTAAAAAQSTANTAQSTANTAKNNAATAQSTANSAATAAANAKTAADNAQATANAALPKAGGTMTGQLKVKGMVLTSGTDYGTTLPAAGTAGRIFFKKA